jgi:hypothetical protein
LFSRAELIIKILLPTKKKKLSYSNSIERLNSLFVKRLTITKLIIIAAVSCFCVASPVHPSDASTQVVFDPSHRSSLIST